MKENQKKKMTHAPEQGDIIHANLDPVHGDIQKKPRPYLVLSNSKLNRSFGTCLVSPITSGVGPNGDALESNPFFIDVVVKKGRGNVKGTVIASQCATIDWRAEEYECFYMGQVTAEVLSEVLAAHNTLTRR